MIGAPTPAEKSDFMLRHYTWLEATGFSSENHWFSGKTTENLLDSRFNLLNGHFGTFPIENYSYLVLDW